jgi:hypothetical protein
MAENRGFFSHQSADNSLASNGLPIPTPLLPTLYICHVCIGQKTEPQVATADVGNWSK